MLKRLQTALESLWWVYMQKLLWNHSGTGPGHILIISKDGDCSLFCCSTTLTVFNTETLELDRCNDFSIPTNARAVCRQSVCKQVEFEVATRFNAGSDLLCREHWFLYCLNCLLNPEDCWCMTAVTLLGVHLCSSSVNIFFFRQKLAVVLRFLSASDFMLRICYSNLKFLAVT